MSHYSSKPQNVRVDFFKPSGKWYGTIEMEWMHYDGKMLIEDAFIRSLQASCNGRYQGMTAVCLEPYHENAHPIMLMDWSSHHPSPLKIQG